MVRLLLLAVVCAAWPIDRVESAIAPLTVVDGSCTAFRIHAERWVTAGHCLTSGVVGATVGEHPVLEVLEHQPGDEGLGVIRVTKTTGPRLTPAFAPRGEDVLHTGHVGGAPRLVFFPAVVMMEAVELNGELAQTYSHPAMPGMSGGPILDRRGRVTGVMMGYFQPTSAPVFVGFGPSYQAVKAFLQKWD